MSSEALTKMIDDTEVTIMSKGDLQILGTMLEETVCENASVFSMMLNSPTVITVAELKEYNEFNSDVAPNISDGISVEISFEEGLKGVNLLYFDAPEAIRLANSTMGASFDEVPDDAELGDLQVSVFGEIASQFSTKMEKSISTLIETKVGSLSPLVKKQDVKGIEIAYGITTTPGIYIKYDMNVENSAPACFYQCICEELAKDMIDKYRAAKNLYEGGKKKRIEEDEPPLKMQTPPVTIQPIKLASFDNAPQVTSDNKNLGLLMDIKLKLTVELGRTEMPIKKLLELSRGSVIELDKIAGEPVDLYANGKLIASGEVVVIEDNFGLRITSILSPDNRIKNI